MLAIKQERIRKKSTTIEHDPFLLIKIIKIQRAWKRQIKLRQLRKKIQRKKNKQYTIKELFDSQKAYCNNLKMLVEHIVIPAKQAIEDEEIHQILFCNLEEIYSMHAWFLNKLDQTLLQYNHLTTKISTVILNELFDRNQFGDKYSQYCANYRKSNKISKLLVTNNSRLHAILSKLNLQQSSSLDSQLIKPMQRLCKYELILSKFHKNMEKQHCDYQDLDKVLQFVEKLVRQTNDQVQEFLLKQKYREIQYQYGKQVMAKIPSQERKLVYSLEDVQLIDLISDTSQVAKEVNLFNDTVMVVLTNSKPIFAKLRIFRDLPNLKYFKNMIQLINQDRYLTISFKKEKQKEQFFGAIKKTDIKEKDQSFVTVSILGTEIRDSVFKNYTVYIAQITFGSDVKAIYPRFKDILRVRDILMQKKIKINLPSLSKQTLFVTNKSKTIQKRKLIIQQFLERILNCAECYSFAQIFKILKLSMKENNLANFAEITINLPSMQVVKVTIDVKNATISELKEAVGQNLGLMFMSQFQIFELRGKDQRRLMYDDQLVLPVFEEQQCFSFNPFKEKVIYIYTRHHYLDSEEQFDLFKEDFVRIQLQLSVIKAEVRHYRLEEELMITYMCLFAMYINLPILDDIKLTNFIKDLGKKNYKISNKEFRAYYQQVQKRVEAEADELITLPFLIIKIISNATLYRCQQFQVQVHPKSFKAIKSYIPSLEEKITLGVKRTQLLLLTCEAKHTVLTIPIECVEIAQLHPTALILSLQDIGPSLRLNTQNAFEISRLFQIYKGKK